MSTTLAHVTYIYVHILYNLTTTSLRLVKENNDFAQKIEDMEAKEANLVKSKKGLQSQIDELNAQLEKITSEKNSIQTQLKTAVR